MRWNVKFCFLFASKTIVIICALYSCNEVASSFQTCACDIPCEVDEWYKYFFLKKIVNFNFYKKNIYRSQWSCDRTCGTGTKTRFRKIVQEPRNNGQA